VPNIPPIVALRNSFHSSRPPAPGSVGGPGPHRLSRISRTTPRQLPRM